MHCTAYVLAVGGGGKDMIRKGSMQSQAHRNSTNAAALVLLCVHVPTHTNISDRDANNG